MADHIIEPHHRGVYEIPLEAGDPVTIDVRPLDRQAHAGAVTIYVHSAGAPVYMRRGTAVTAREAQAEMVPPSMVADLPLGRTAAGLVTFVCATNAIISVCRP